MHKTVLLLSACALSLLPTSTNTLAQTKDETSFAKDAAILRESLEALYPSLNRYGQQDAVYNALNRLENTAQRETDTLSFYRAVVDVTVATKDEHVIPFPSEAFRNERRTKSEMLPYTIRWIDNDPFISAVADPIHSALVGKRVVQFDGMAVQSVANTLRASIPSDGRSQTFAFRRLQDFTPTQNENYFDLNYPLWFGARRAYEVTTEDQHGSAMKTTLEALDWRAFSAFYRERLSRDAPISFDWIRPKVGYLSILSFHDWYYEEHRIDPQKHLARIFEELHKHDGAKLILDLRRNEGGGDVSSDLLDYLLQEPFVEYDAVLTRFVGKPKAARYCENSADVAFNPEWAEPFEDGLFKLKAEFANLITGATPREPRDKAFDGELIVLISGATGSAAAKVASVLEREDRAIFIGEETGGAAAGATAYGYCSLRLPHSDVRVDIPLIRFERSSEIPYGRGVLPNIEVDAGRTPPLARSDEPLEKALRLLSSRTHQ